ncbi:coproporphyrinogen-III oxidase family protein [Sulfobacillus thermosulfidooxidans]|uniref:coproporphyrinogen-III oxidase family protein n=1 Tax=Sulfobacillus thermosulfidooxidans TaxID=28034 RepID=UPI0006B45E65|nr:coproporphyrinogen-III oxidase family protein [Sulfobacillus thermosulfidooxidans]
MITSLSAPFESFTYPFFDLNFHAQHDEVVNAFLKTPSHFPGLRGMYIHVPFCETLCHFCPFYKNVGNDERIEAYVQALETELHLRSQDLRVRHWTFDAIYFGGGTPSLLTIAQIRRLLCVIRNSFSLSPDCEISMEIEVKSITEDKLLELKDLGVTRVSFGVQTFNPDMRKFLNLTATLEQVDAAIAASTRIFPRANNIDLIVGLPTQTTADMYTDLDIAIRCGIDSLSIYPMDYIMTTPRLIELFRQGITPLPPTASAIMQMFYDARKYLKQRWSEDNTYCYSREGISPCRYMFDIVYGNYSNEYIGIGASAYSLLQGLVYQNVPDEREYIRRLQTGLSPVHLSSPYHAYEKGLVFFPKIGRYDLKDLRRWDYFELYSERLERLRHEGFVKIIDDMITLTSAGELHYAPLMLEFFSDNQKRLYNRIWRRVSTQLGWNVETGRPTDCGPAHKSVGGLSAMAIQSLSRRT